MEQQHLHKKGIQIHSQKPEPEPEPENDDYEALSLCDLPTNEPEDPKQNHLSQLFYTKQEDHDFAFGSNQPKNKMCTADELFFRGHILPLRHSVTLPSRLTTRTEEFTRSISVSISEPARSTRNRFHSYPSPTPRIRTRSIRQTNTSPSSKWRLLQLGPMKVEGIGLSGQKNRCEKNEGNKKQKQMLLLSCKCSADVVESTVCASMVKQMTLNEDCVSKDTNVGRRKHVVSSHRTSEWLKQLFVQKYDPSSWR